MRTNYTIRIIVVFVIITIKAGAQALSGIYTIDNNMPASAGNFQSFGTFATALNTHGVASAVTVNVAAGNYNEQVIFNQAAGVSPVNRVTVNGNGSTLAYSSALSAAPFTMLLNGADYMTFNNLNVNAQGATYAIAVMLTNSANYNVFSSATFSCPVNGTGSATCPFAITSLSTSPVGSGANSGNFNTVTSCTMANGYYGITFYGLTSTPYQQGNSLINSLVTDFYYYGVYYPYAKGQTIKGTIIERPTRLTSSAVYALYGWQNQAATIEGNKIWKLYENNLNAGSTCYAMYVYGNPMANGDRTVIRNNIITGIKNNGSAYGIYAHSSNSDIYNNTIDMDNVNAGSGTICGIYAYGAQGFNNTIYNNIISVCRGASSGAKYGISFGGVTGNITCDKNVIYMNNTAGANYYGYYSAAAASFASYQAQGLDAGSYSVNPMFANQAAYDLHPTNAAIDNQGVFAGLLLDQSSAIRNQTTPDLGALEFLTPNCNGTPSLTSVISPTYQVCPGSSSTLALNTIQSDLGISFQWQQSAISQVGPWTNISGANLPVYTTTAASSPLYYSVKVSCASSSVFTQASSGQVVVACTTTSSVPYNEGFENIAYTGMLPNCSWVVSGAVQTYTATGTNYRLPHNGSHKFASFDGAAAGTKYVYTNGIQLQAGVTYSTGLYYLTEYTGQSGFTDLSVMLGTTQSTTGLTTIASSNGPAVATQYKLLSGTFTVAASGIYYLAIKASNYPVSYYLSFDDVFVNIPCSLNSPVLSVTGTSTVCLGNPVNLAVSGADSYTWSSIFNPSLSTLSTLSTTPLLPGSSVYMVSGTRSLSHCSSSIAQTVEVVPGPVVSAYALDPNNKVCPGVVNTLYTAGSATSYTWSTTGLAAPTTTIMPTANTVYTVVGSDGSNCTSQATISITLKTPPVVAGAASHSAICAGESVALTASGASTYSWVAANVYLIGSNVTASPLRTTDYQLTGTDLSTGCTASVQVSVNVSRCTGIDEVLLTDNAIRVYPNPSQGQFTVALSGAADKTIKVMDVTGRELISVTTTEVVFPVDISRLAAGAYYVHVQSAEGTGSVKVLKQ